MPNRTQRDSIEFTNHTPPDRHHGGRELPDELQDRPEQNAVYDAVVRGERRDEDFDLADLDEILESDGVLDETEPLDDEDLTH